MAIHIGNNNTAKKLGITNYKGAFICLVDGNNEAEKAAMFREAIR